MTVIYDKVVVIGMGLIGASIALAVRRGGLATTIIGSDQSPEVAATVARLQLVDSFEADAAHAVADADLVIMAVPVGAVGKIAEQIVPHMKSGAVLTDTGSTKRSVVRDVGPHLRDDIIWLPSHPLAGTEHSGPGAGFESLFDKRYWIILPLDPHLSIIARTPLYDMPSLHPAYIIADYLPDPSGDDISLYAVPAADGFALTMIDGHHGNDAVVDAPANLPRDARLVGIYAR